jgi:hypothetical protein
MNRKLVASLAYGINSSRLYGTPLQFLDIEKEISILDYIIELLKEQSVLTFPKILGDEVGPVIAELKSTLAEVQ